MNKILFVPFLIVLSLFPLKNFSQSEQLHGDQAFSAYGIHYGNQIRTTVWNDGMIGSRWYMPSNTQFSVEWPYGSGRNHLSKLAPFFGAEVLDANDSLRHIVSESNGTRPCASIISSGDFDSTSGQWWTMTPLPGFHNPVQAVQQNDLPQIAMSQNRWSWPEAWPDKLNDSNDPGWADLWNGYHRKDLATADQESFFMMDDYQNREFDYFPDSTDSSRRGLGIRVGVRGMQWSHSKLEDIIFFLFEFQNIGTQWYDKVVFGLHDGAAMCGAPDGPSGANDYNFEYNLGHGYCPWENIWGPPWHLGIAFLQTASRNDDGIDNDRDGDAGSGAVITREMFQPKKVAVGDAIIITNYTTYTRTISTMPENGIHFTAFNREYSILPGELVEVPHNLIDDNLNGLIDENDACTFQESHWYEKISEVTRYRYEGVKCIDYFTGEGSDNPLIDESRYDGIDNDADWNPEFDDVGLDGVPNTGDFGESDGLPTSGAGTNLPGEPHIDRTDGGEADWIGLTAFVPISYYSCTYYTLQEDEHLWEAVLPDNFILDPYTTTPDFIIGTGYFPLKPEEMKQNSIALMLAYSDTALLETARNAQMVAANDFLFPKAPEIPTVTATAGDRTITIKWDNIAETTPDPVLGLDFEGYRIYRCSQQDSIVEQEDIQTHFELVAAFDLKDGIKGLSQTTQNGVQFDLGNDTGLVHTWTDSNLVNGRTYYYAVTSYDRGQDSTNLFPLECPVHLQIDYDGEILLADDGGFITGRNIVTATPEYKAIHTEDAQIQQKWLSGSTTNSSVQIFLHDKSQIGEKTFHITFEDTLIRDSFWMKPVTKNFTLTNVTNPDNPIPIINKCTNFEGLIAHPDFQMFNLMLHNYPFITLNEDSSKWNRENIYRFYFREAYSNHIFGDPEADNYRIEIGEVGVATSIPFFDYPSKAVNFRILRESNDEEIDFAFYERDGNDGRLTTNPDTSLGDRIYFLKKTAIDSLVLSWQFELGRSGSDSTTRNPAPGDVCRIYLNKPFLSNDILEIKTIPATVPVIPIPEDFHLAQNFPNPFNSVTRINYGLPQKCRVLLTIYNIQGQRIRTLVNREETEGYHTIIWRGTNQLGLPVASGVYFYLFEAGDFHQVKRMVMLK